jgi:hypothetical protein
MLSVGKLPQIGVPDCNPETNNPRKGKTLKSPPIGRFFKFSRRARFRDLGELQLFDHLGRPQRAIFRRHGLRVDQQQLRLGRLAQLAYPDRSEPDDGFHV